MSAISRPGAAILGVRRQSDRASAINGLPDTPLPLVPSAVRQVDLPPLLPAYDSLLLPVVSNAASSLLGALSVGTGPVNKPPSARVYRCMEPRAEERAKWRENSAVAVFVAVLLAILFLAGLSAVVTMWPTSEVVVTSPVYPPTAE